MRDGGSDDRTASSTTPALDAVARAWTSVAVATPAAPPADVVVPPPAVELPAPVAPAPPTPTVPSTSPPASPPDTIPLPPAPASTEVELARLRTLELAFDAVIPLPWRTLYPRSYGVSGGTPVTWDTGAVVIPASVVDGDPAFLRVVVAHEWGHLLTMTFGAAGFGSPPAGFPSGTANPIEEWADCVSVALTGVVAPSHGLPPCSAAALAWVAAFIAAGPS